MLRYAIFNRILIKPAGGRVGNAMSVKSQEHVDPSTSIPIVDLASPREVQRNGVGNAATSVGFMYVKNTPFVSAEQAKRLCKLWYPLLRDGMSGIVSLPSDPAIMRGFSQIFSEDTSKVYGTDGGPDCCARYTSGPIDRTGDQSYWKADHLLTAPNLWPESDLYREPRKEWEAYYRGIERLMFFLLELLMEYLGLDRKSMERLFEQHTSLMRFLYYPPLDSGAIGDTPAASNKGMRMSAHQDITGISILYQTTELGGEGDAMAPAALQVRPPERSQWIDVPHRPDCFVVNFGFLMLLWSGYRVRASTHRVVMKPDARVTVGFFGQPRTDLPITALLPVTDDHPHDPITLATIDRLKQYEGLPFWELLMGIVAQMQHD